MHNSSKSEIRFQQRVFTYCALFRSSTSNSIPPHKLPSGGKSSALPLKCGFLSVKYIKHLLLSLFAPPQCSNRESMTVSRPSSKAPLCKQGGVNGVSGGAAE